MRKQKNKIRSAVTGLMLSLMILLAQPLFYFQHSSSHQHQTSSQRQNNGALQTKVYASVTVYSLPSSSQVEVIAHEFSLIQEILFNPLGFELATATDIAPAWRKFLCTLFRVIISSNAP